MGLTYITAGVANHRKSERRIKVRMLVDSGALFSVIPRDVVLKLGIKPHGKESFILANGDEITRQIGSATFYYRDKWGPSKIIIGESGDSALMGVLTLESLGYALDPIRRELRPMKMVLM